MTAIAGIYSYNYSGILTSTEIDLIAFEHGYYAVLTLAAVVISLLLRKKRVRNTDY